MLKNKILMPNHKERQDGTKSFAVFLAIAFAALVIICVLGYVKFSDFGSDENAVIIVKDAPSKSMVKAKEAINKKLPQAQEAMGVPKASLFSGRWVSVLGENKIAELVFGGGQFEVIYTADSQGRLRKYSKGTFSYNEKTGVLNLRPSRVGGEPSPIKGVIYSVLTMRAFDMEVKQQGAAGELYFIAEKESLLSRNVHPLFLYADYAGAPVLKFSKAK